MMYRSLSFANRLTGVRWLIYHSQDCLRLGCKSKTGWKGLACGVNGVFHERSFVASARMGTKTVNGSEDVFERLKERYAVSKESIFGVNSETTELPQVDQHAIFTTNEIDLTNISAFGFDYDYTLANYTDNLLPLIYNCARDILIQDFRYPKEILDVDYDPEFAIRGLHYDKKRGLLLKIDSFHNIQLDAVYLGRNRVPVAETLAAYKGEHISIDYMNSNMTQLRDIFSLPEACLLANLTQFFIDNMIRFDSEYLYSDVNKAISLVHTSGTLYKSIIANLELYLHRSEGIGNVLSKLRQNGKKVFLLTNSPFEFVNAGMSYMVSPRWREFFDVIIVQAHKPKFYDSDRPFRRLDVEFSQPTWHHVNTFRPGNVYCEGNHRDFTRMTGWSGSSVLYIGDHIYSDLADPSLKHGWRTAGIIKELQNEIKIQNSVKYQQKLTWLMNISRIIKEGQYLTGNERRTLELWKKESNDIRVDLKSLFNPQFGSLFRTHVNPSYFAHKINRFADLYTARVENFLNYPADHSFYPRRMYLPHEAQGRRNPDGTYRFGV